MEVPALNKEDHFCRLRGFRGVWGLKIFGVIHTNVLIPCVRDPSFPTTALTLAEQSCLSWAVNCLWSLVAQTTKSWVWFSAISILTMQEIKALYSYQRGPMTFIPVCQVFVKYLQDFIIPLYRRTSMQLDTSHPISRPYMHCLPTTTMELFKSLNYYTNEGVVLLWGKH